MLFRIASSQLFARVTGKAGVVVSQPSRSVVSAVLLPNSPSMNHRDVAVGTVATTTRPFPYQVRNVSKKKTGKSRWGSTPREINPEVFKVYPVYGSVQSVRAVEQYEDPQFIQGTKDLGRVKMAISDAFGYDDVNGTIKIFNSTTQQFDPLNSIKQLEFEQDKMCRVFVSQAYPEDEEDGRESHDELDDEDYGDYNPEDEMDSRTLPMKETLKDIVIQLKGMGCTRGKDGIMEHDGICKSTKELVLEIAADDERLQDILLRKVCALDHIVDCVHFDFVWDAKSDSDNIENDEDTAGTGGIK